MSMTSLPTAIVARTTLLESDAKSIVPTSEIVWAGILAVAEVTSSLIFLPVGGPPSTFLISTLIPAIS